MSKFVLNYRGERFEFASLEEFDAWRKTLPQEDREYYERVKLTTSPDGRLSLSKNSPGTDDEPNEVPVPPRTTDDELPPGPDEITLDDAPHADRSFPSSDQSVSMDDVSMDDVSIESGEEFDDVSIVDDFSGAPSSQSSLTPSPGVGGVPVPPESEIPATRVPRVGLMINNEMVYITPQEMRDLLAAGSVKRNTPVYINDVLYSAGDFKPQLKENLDYFTFPQSSDNMVATAAIIGFVVVALAFVAILLLADRSEPQKPETEPPAPATETETPGVQDAQIDENSETPDDVVGEGEEPNSGEDETAEAPADGDEPSSESTPSENDVPEAPDADKTEPNTGEDEPTTSVADDAQTGETIDDGPDEDFGSDEAPEDPFEVDEESKESEPTPEPTTSDEPEPTPEEKTPVEPENPSDQNDEVGQDDSSSAGEKNEEEPRNVSIDGQNWLTEPFNVNVSKLPPQFRGHSFAAIRDALSSDVFRKPPRGPNESDEDYKTRCDTAEYRANNAFLFGTIKPTSRLAFVLPNREMVLNDPLFQRSGESVTTRYDGTSRMLTVAKSLGTYEVSFFDSLYIAPFVLLSGSYGLAIESSHETGFKWANSESYHWKIRDIPRSDYERMKDSICVLCVLVPDYQGLDDTGLLNAAGNYALYTREAEFWVFDYASGQILGKYSFDDTIDEVPHDHRFGHISPGSAAIRVNRRSIKR